MITDPTRSGAFTRVNVVKVTASKSFMTAGRMHNTRRTTTRNSGRGSFEFEPRLDRLSASLDFSEVANTRELFTKKKDKVIEGRYSSGFREVSILICPRKFEMGRQ